MSNNYKYLSFGIVALVALIISFNINTESSQKSEVMPRVDKAPSIDKNPTASISPQFKDAPKEDNPVDSEYDLNSSAAPTGDLPPIYNSEEDELAAKRKMEKFFAGESAKNIKVPVVNVDFNPYLEVDYRQKFKQAKKVLFNVKTLHEEYQLDLSRAQLNTSDGSWYSGYVKGTNIRTLVKAFPDKVAIYIYKPGGKIKISKSLNKKQKYINNKKPPPSNEIENYDETTNTQSNFFETRNDYYIIDESSLEYVHESELYRDKVNPSGVFDDDSIVERGGNNE